MARSGWRAASPGATRSSSSTAATTATPTACSSAAGSGVATLGIPGSAGVTAGHRRRHAHRAAATTRRRCARCFDGQRRARSPRVIVEPVCGNMGCVPPQPGYLAGAARADASARRRAHLRRGHDRLPRRYGGAQALYGIEPDLTTLGKIVGGGLPVGGLRRPREIMVERRARRAGLPGGHALGQSAGRGRRHARCWSSLAAPRHLRGARSDRRRTLVDGLAALAREAGIAAHVEPRRLDVHRLLHRPTPVTDYATRQEVATPRASASFFHAMLDARRLPGAVAVRGGVRLAGARRPRHRPHARSRPPRLRRAS